MVNYDEEKEVYRIDYELPKIFNFYWDEYNQDQEFLFSFVFD
ncbi:MAG: hypothetical protein NY202_01970 [Mollicutes bacterium UO1]